MCGIAGFIDLNGFSLLQAQNIGKSMGKAIQHRGPDDSGLWIEKDYGVVLVHQRLAILDLTQFGHQPMLSGSGRYVICFNGEIYNHKQLRSELDLNGEAPNWRGHSDTETILACFDAYGIKQTLKKLVGMFSIALWDKSTKQIFLARDRMGEKPLYYGKHGKLLLFSSELKALHAHPNFSPNINKDSLSLYIRYNYIPQPFSIYRGIKKLPPGHFVRLKQNTKPEPFYSLSHTVTSGKMNIFKGSETEVINRVENTLKNTVKSQMQSDVPLGAFLSGGVDSSLILALMQEQQSRRVQSFSIGFDDKNYNEAPFAKKIAKYIGTDHSELYVDARQARNIIPYLPKIYDEPFSDSSQIPTLLLTQFAKKSVKVSLSGDGGDEIFGGYNRYTWVKRSWPKFRYIPKPFKNLMAKLITSIPPSRWNIIAEPILSIMPQKFQYVNFGDKLHKLSSILNCVSTEELYRTLISNCDTPNDIVISGKEPKTKLNFDDGILNALSNVEKLMFYDTLMYLSDDILVKVDRAAMNFSLETRAPFLDHRLIDLAWQLPFNFKIRNGINKWCLRELLYKRIPKQLIERPKMGFGVPIGDWLKGPLREWVFDLLDKKRMEQSGYFKTSEIHERLEQHISGKKNWQYFLWNILMFETWRKDMGL